MKYLKMLGLAAIAALGLMAFVGAGTASATKLCTNSGCTSIYPEVETIHATLESGTSAKLTDTSGNVIATCTSSTVHGFTSNNNTGATWVTGNVATAGLTWGGCNQPTATTEGGAIDIMWTSGTSGAVRGTGFEVTVEIFGISCTYSALEGTELGTITGGEAPTLKIETVVSKKTGGFLCPSTAGWDAAYIVTAPHALFVGS